MDIFARTPTGSFGSGELLAEYFCIVFVISLIVIIYSKELSQLRIKEIPPFIMLFFAVTLLIIIRSRSSIILASAAMIFIMLHNFTLIPANRNTGRTVLVVGIAVLSIVFFLKFGSYFSLEKVIEKFETVDLPAMSLESIASGDSINRRVVYAIGYQRLAEKSWWIGYGYNLPENNRESLGISDFTVKDYHSLYLSLPIFYGWVGAASYISVVLFTGIRAYRCYWRNRKRSHYLVPIALGFAIVWGVFLFDQFKVTLTRNPSYFLLTWFLLGWTHSVVNCINNENNNY